VLRRASAVGARDDRPAGGGRRRDAHHYTLATIDSLTGLHLRDYFFRRFEEEYTRVRRYAGAFSILMLDLDGFKEINDRHGHLAGDRYLRALGAAIRARMRGADLACRYGGDEFCILLPETDLAGARPIAERLRQALARLVVDVEEASLRTTVDRIASYPEHDTGEIRASPARGSGPLPGEARGAIASSRSWLSLDILPIDHLSKKET
jgi:diguanylate cyclase (GGDEF)-like protein